MRIVLKSTKAIEKLIEQRSIADDIEELSLTGTLENLKSLKTKITNNELPFISDHKNAQDTFDKALITSGKAPRHSNQTLNVNTQNNIHTNIGLSAFYGDT